MSKYISSELLDFQDAISASDNDKAGALVIFSGQVRNHHLGKSVDYLEYESHIEMADTVIADILNEAQLRWELHYVYCKHRIGKVMIGESAVVVITSASHRDTAYEANRFIIDKVKAEAPIWKKEFFSDGNIIWAENI